MNWIRHIFFKIKKSEDDMDSFKKELFDVLSKFAEKEPSFALEQLKSAENGLGSEEVKKRLKQYGIKTSRGYNRRGIY